MTFGCVTMNYCSAVCGGWDKDHQLWWVQESSDVELRTRSAHLQNAGVTCYSDRTLPGLQLHSSV